jgi:hypothetical protein
MQEPRNKVLPIAYLIGVVMHGLWNGFATMPFILDGEKWVYISLSLLALMVAICLVFIVKILEYGKEYSHIELEATSFKDLE